MRSRLKNREVSIPVATKNATVHAVGAGIKTDGLIDLDIDGLEAINTRKVLDLTGNAPNDPAANADAPQPAGAKREIVIGVIGGLITSLVVGSAGLLWSWLL